MPREKKWKTIKNQPLALMEPKNSSQKYRLHEFMKKGIAIREANDAN